MIGEHLIKRSTSPALSAALHDVSLCLEGICGYLEYLRVGVCQFTQGEYLTVESKRKRFQVRLPLHGPIEAVRIGAKPDLIQIIVEPLRPHGKYQFFTSELQQAFDGIFQASFLRYYLQGADKLLSAVGDDWKWEKNWRFAWAIRNAIAHDGKIDIRNSSKKPVEWDGLRFAHADNGHPVLAQDIGMADLVALMIAMDQELREVVRAVKQPVDLKNE